MNGGVSRKYSWLDLCVGGGKYINWEEATIFLQILYQGHTLIYIFYLPYCKSLGQILYTTLADSFSPSWWWCQDSANHIFASPGWSVLGPSSRRHDRKTVTLVRKKRFVLSCLLLGDFLHATMAIYTAIFIEELNKHSQSVYNRRN